MLLRYIAFLVFVCFSEGKTANIRWMPMISSLFVIKEAPAKYVIQTCCLSPTLI